MATLSQKFTHPKMYKEATGEEAVISLQDIDTFKRSIDPLVKYGKLGAFSSINIIAYLRGSQF